MFKPALGIPLSYSYTAAGRQTAEVFHRVNAALAGGDLAPMLLVSVDLREWNLELLRRVGEATESLNSVSPDIANVDDDDPVQERLGAQITSLTELIDDCDAAIAMLDVILPDDASGA